MKPGVVDSFPKEVLFGVLDAGSISVCASFNDINILLGGLVMKNKFLVTLCTLVLSVLVLAIPASANNVALKVNDDPVKSAELFVDSGVAMISVEDFARIAGADVNYSEPDKLVIGEDGKTLSLTVGKSTALLEDKNVTLPCAPVKTGGVVMIPLRFVAVAFGYDVQWDGKQWLVSLTRKEIRDNMTPEDLLVKSSQACQEFNTYAMEGSIDYDMNFSQAGADEEKMPAKFSSQIYSQYQNKPFAVYMKQTINIDNKELMPGDTVIETYMTPEKMYMKLPQQEWTVQAMPFPAEFWKQQQDIQSDPIKAVAQMKEFGMLFNFANDENINGNDYYVINATMDMEKFMQGYQKIVSQIVQNLPAEGQEVGSVQEMQDLMQKMLENMVIDSYYTTYINKDTLVSDIVKFNMKINIIMDLPGVEESGGEQEKSSLHNINISINTLGDFYIKDCGKPFAAPDISKAKAAIEPGN
jgi:hypothetical protein